MASKYVIDGSMNNNKIDVKYKRFERIRQNINKIDVKYKRFDKIQQILSKSGKWSIITSEGSEPSSY